MMINLCLPSERLIFSSFLLRPSNGRVFPANWNDKYAEERKPKGEISLRDLWLWIVCVWSNQFTFPPATRQSSALRSRIVIELNFRNSNLCVCALWGECQVDKALWRLTDAPVNVVRDFLPDSSSIIPQPTAGEFAFSFHAGGSLLMQPVARVRSTWLHVEFEISSRVGKIKLRYQCCRPRCCLIRRKADNWARHTFAAVFNQQFHQPLRWKLIDDVNQFITVCFPVCPFS